jgi:curli biogenesis system outer membrane secretion channel CsgG
MAMTDSNTMISTESRRRRFPGNVLTLVAGLVLAIVGAACATAPTHAPAVAEQTPPPEYRGPRKTIAVARFDGNGAFLARYGGWEVGGGLAAQLSSELSRSSRFVLVERAELPNVLREQEMALRGVTTSATSPRAGELLGAQLLVRGSVTEFNESDNGGGFSLGGNLSSSFSGAISPRTRNGHVSIDLRVIDTTTGRVLLAHTVSRRIKQRSIAFGGVGNGVSFSADRFESSALGQATREAIAEAVVYLESELADVPWSAQVAKVSGGQVYLNAGANANLQVGQPLTVYEVTDRVVDPVTQEVLGVEHSEVGTIVIEDVQPRYARGSFLGSRMPLPGSVVRYHPGRLALGFKQRTATYE